MMTSDIVMHSITISYLRLWIKILGLNLWSRSRMIPILGIIWGPFENLFKTNQLSLVVSISTNGSTYKVSLVSYVFLNNSLATLFL